MTHQNKNCLLPIYPQRDLTLVRGKRALLFDANGKEYIDCASNIGVNNIGYGVNEVAKAINEQYLTLSNCYGIFESPVREKCAGKLVEISPKNLTQVFFCNSGSESIEGAIKFARATSGKKDIIAFMRGFHGKTLGALSVTWGKEYTEPFKPLIPGIKHAPYNNFEKLQQLITKDTGALLIELVQGEGGIRIAEKEYMQKIRKLCDDKNILLIIDEVQTGFGRCGTMFALEQFVVPDILCLAKSIAGGLSMGAIICSDKIKIPIQSHTTTFGGSPVACAASLATIDYIEKNDLVSKSKELGKYFINKLNEIQSNKIQEVRGLGLLIGVELKDRATQIVKHLQENGVIALLAGKRVVRFIPPLVITKDQIDIVVDKFKAALES